MARKKDAYFNLFIDDFLGGVADLTAEERGVYITLLCLMYDRDEGMLYDDDSRWAHRNNMSTRKYRIIKNKLLTECKLCIVQRDTEPFLTNDRVLSEQKTRQTMKDKNANSGRIGGMTTAENKRKPNEINGADVAPAVASGNGEDTAYQLQLQQEVSKNPPIVPQGTKAKRRRCQLPADSPSSRDKELALAYWRKEGVSLDADKQAERFRAHHESKGSRMMSWSAAWKTWYCNAVEFARPADRAKSEQTSPYNFGDDLPNPEERA